MQKIQKLTYYYEVLEIGMYLPRYIHYKPSYIIPSTYNVLRILGTGLPFNFSATYIRKIQRLGGIGVKKWISNDESSSLPVFLQDISDKTIKNSETRKKSISKD
jgi:hypothetical protein